MYGLKSALTHYERAPLFRVGFNTSAQDRRKGAPLMDSRKFIGMDVHQPRISNAARDAAGKLVIETLIATKATTILEFLQGLKGTMCVAFEEGTSAAWM